jgi:tetratricopeptide (TPR) repeat protein
MSPSATSSPTPSTGPVAALTPAARKFLDETTMKSLLGIPDEALDAIMAVAYQLYQAGRYPEVDVLCRGLVAADHKYWWSYSLHAATLRRLGRLREALAEVDKGLVYEPGQAKLLSMQSELRAALARGDSGAPEGAAPTIPSTSPVAA